MSLIEREALIKAIEIDRPEQATYTKKDAVECVLCMPAIEAAPVVHGRWMFNADTWTWDCTNCKGWVGSGIMISRYKHCPNCGARMGGGEGHETD